MSEYKMLPDKNIDVKEILKDLKATVKTQRLDMEKAR